jgi:hypothetical protein
MSMDEWEGWPALGSRVVIPCGPDDLVGEVVAHRRTMFSGRQVAAVRVVLPERFQPEVVDGEDEFFYDERDESERPDDEPGAYAYETYEPCGPRMLDVPMPLELIRIVCD